MSEFVGGESVPNRSPEYGENMRMGCDVAKLILDNHGKRHVSPDGRVVDVVVWGDENELPEYKCRLIRPYDAVEDPVGAPYEMLLDTKEVYPNGEVSETRFFLSPETRTHCHIYLQLTDEQRRKLEQRLEQPTVISPDGTAALPPDPDGLTPLDESRILLSRLAKGLEHFAAKSN